MEDNDRACQLEAVLFAAGEPVSAQQLCSKLDISQEQLRAAAEKLSDYYLYERRGIRLLYLDGAYQLVSSPEHAQAVRAVLERSRPQKLSPAALEVLSVIAYYQPVTKVYIEQLRGLDCSYTLASLAERGLIEEAGRLLAPGRPILYRTTKEFLRVFGLSSLSELPKLPAGDEDTQLSLEDLMEKV
jgi:segregation and condensation protein B